MNLRSKSKISTEFSLASMSDMIFLLLIFFLITSTLVSPSGVKVVLPKGDITKPNPESVTVSITADKRIHFDNGKIKEYTSIERLPSQLQSALSNDKDAVVAIAADKSVPYENVMEVVVLATKMKYKILLRTEK
jgi:biopolymer transport protein ExbD